MTILECVEGCKRSLRERGGRGRPPLHGQRDCFPKWEWVKILFEFACLWIAEKFQWKSSAGNSKVPPRAEGSALADPCAWSG